jgi:hypothetical protein
MYQQESELLCEAVDQSHHLDVGWPTQEPAVLWASGEVLPKHCVLLRPIQLACYFGVRRVKARRACVKLDSALKAAAQGSKTSISTGRRKMKIAEKRKGSSEQCQSCRYPGDNASIF